MQDSTINDFALTQVHHTRRLIEEMRYSYLKAEEDVTLDGIKLIMAGIDMSLDCLDYMEQQLKKV